MIVEATFTSVWDGEFHITTNCKVDLETKEVMDIEMSEISSVEILDREYITLPNGRECNVFLCDERESEDEFWYR